MVLLLEQYSKLQMKGFSSYTFTKTAICIDRNVWQGIHNTTVYYKAFIMLIKQVLGQYMASWPTNIVEKTCNRKKEKLGHLGGSVD